MFEKMLPDVFHAQLHMRRNKLVFKPETTTPEFIEQNKEILNTMFKTMKESYPMLGPQHKRLMELGITTFLIAEGGTYR